MRTFEFRVYVVRDPNPTSPSKPWAAYCIDPVPQLVGKGLVGLTTPRRISFDQAFEPATGATKDDALQELKHRLRAHFGLLKEDGYEVDQVEVPIRIE